MNTFATDTKIPDWMGTLARQYSEQRHKYPDEKLLIMFDIDGTILDTRYMILHVLRLYDQTTGSRHFVELGVDDISFNENQVDQQLQALGIPESEHALIMEYYLQKRWSREAILESHRPFGGVLEVIRWFQLQPNTDVGLNTGRSEEIRADTLRSLNELGREYRVEFPDELLYMNQIGWDQEVENAKAAGLTYFIGMGFRVIAFIDNEPQNLAAIAGVDGSEDILLLHAQTLFETSRKYIPDGTVGGQGYALAQFITESTVPRHIQFVWHAGRNLAQLDHFLSSNISWIELDVRHDPRTGEVIIRHRDLEERPIESGEQVWPLEPTLKALHGAQKRVKFDIKEGGDFLDRLLVMLEQIRFEDEDLWFNGNIERLQESGFRRLHEHYPYATLQCPVDFLAPVILGVPDQGRAFLNLLAGWGVDRFSINWHTLNKRQVINQLDEWGLPVNIFHTPNLESFLKAALLQPRSVSSKFGLPHW
ncbi:HAD family hydrolase [Candidatus Neomarinimicrobiota bacterium]